MTQIPNPTTLVGAAIVAQFSLLLIMFLPSFVLHRTEREIIFHRRLDTYAVFAWFLLPFGLVTLGFLTFSDAIAPVWQEVLGEARFPGVPWKVALLIMFIADIFFVAFLVRRSHGSYSSPFSPIFFVLPPIAIFLREPFARVVLYVSLIALLFTFALYVPSHHPYQRDDREMRGLRHSYYLVSLLCFALATLIGYLTRPH